MIYGYARVSTNHQDTELQRNVVELAGCELICEQRANGRKSNRPVLRLSVGKMCAGDELVVWKLDRIGRNVLHVLLMFQQLQENGVNFRSIIDGVGLSTASGRYNIRNILSAALYEFDLNSERTLAGLAIARARGHIGGRKPKFTEQQWHEMVELIAARGSRRRIAIIYKDGVSTLYRKFPAINRLRVKFGSRMVVQNFMMMFRDSCKRGRDRLTTVRVLPYRTRMRGDSRICRRSTMC